MESDGLVETLEDAGLSPYQAAAYVAVLELGAASATDVAEVSEVPQPRIYDVLAALDSKGYVETYETDSMRVRAHSPADVLADLRERASRFETAAAEVEERWEQPELESNRASIVKRFQTVIERAEAFIHEAEYQVQLSLSPAQFDRLRPALRAAHERGVSVRVLVHTDPDAALPERERFEGVCLEVRHRPFPAPFVVLVDRDKTCFAHTETANDYGVLVSDRTHTYVFHWYFLTCLWEGWNVVHSTHGRTFPVEYADIRQCVREVSPLLEAGAVVTVHIDGYRIESGEAVEVTGELEEVVVGGSPRGEVVETFAGQVGMVVATGDGPVSVGGWGAMIEDVEATRITVEAATRPDGTAAGRPKAAKNR